MFRVASPCASIEIRSLFGGWLDALVPELREIGRAFQQLGLAFFLRFDEAAGAGSVVTTSDQ